MFKTTKIALTIFIFFISQWVISQNDFGLWIGGDLRVPIIKKLDLGIEVQGRFDSNASRVQKTFISPYLKYNLMHHLELGLDLRISNRPKDEELYGSQYTCRTTVDLDFKKLVDYFKEDSRFDISTRIRGTYEVGEGDLNSSYLRGRLKFSYNIPGIKLEPELSAELFYNFNNQLVYTAHSIESRNRFNKCRWVAGLNYSFNKTHSVKLFYLYQNEIDGPNRDFIVGFGYTVKLKQLIAK